MYSTRSEVPCSRTIDVEQRRATISDIFALLNSLADYTGFVNLEEMFPHQEQAIHPTKKGTAVIRIKRSA
jgi:hypothetical protein